MVQLEEGKPQYKTYPILNTIECTILPDEKLDCKIIGRTITGGPLPDDFFDNVFSIKGDISVLSGGDKRIWVKPIPVGETCAIVARKRGESDFPKGTDLIVLCGAKSGIPEAIRTDIPEEWWDKYTQWKPLGDWEPLGDDFFYQKAGSWSDPDLWDKAKEKYPNSPYEAWRWYWDESKKRREG